MFVALGRTMHVQQISQIMCMESLKRLEIAVPAQPSQSEQGLGLLPSRGQVGCDEGSGCLLRVSPALGHHTPVTFDI